MSKRVLTRLSILSCLLIKRLPKGRGGGRGRGQWPPQNPPTPLVSFMLNYIVLLTAI